MAGVVTGCVARGVAGGIAWGCPGPGGCCGVAWGITRGSSVGGGGGEVAGDVAASVQGVLHAEVAGGGVWCVQGV